VRRAAAFALLSLGFAALAAEPVQAPGKGRAYALVAAMGDRLMATHEVKRTGSNLPPYRRTGLEAPDNVLNRLVLAGLDEAVGKMEPTSTRTHLAIAVRSPRTDSTSMEAEALEAVVAHLRARPERSAWDRIVVATPAYRTLKVDGMPTRSQGFGVFMQPLCQSQQGACGMDTDGTSSSAAETVQTPGGETIKANQFVAPYVFLKVWILDPRTLEVIESQEIFEYQKMWDPKADTTDLSEVIPKRVLAAQIVKLAEHATEEAVKRTELRATVEVKERGAVKEVAPK
jgi:hypothetical protein